MQMLRPGTGCLKYDEELVKVFASDWVRKYEEQNKVSRISSVTHV